MLRSKGVAGESRQSKGDEKTTVLTESLDSSGFPRGIVVLTDGSNSTRTEAEEQKIRQVITEVERLNKLQAANRGRSEELYERIDATTLASGTVEARTKALAASRGAQMKLFDDSTTRYRKSVDAYYRQLRADTGEGRAKQLGGRDFIVEAEIPLGRDDSGIHAEEYVRIFENAFLPVAGDEAVSTFSIDVDTASYANMRRYLNDHMLPPPDAVRIEELINYFQYDYPQPEGDVPFSVTMETADCPWKAGHQLLRIGLKGKEIDAAQRPASNLVFLLDVSGSMKSAAKLPLLKAAMKLLVGELNESDRVTIVTYAGDAGLALDSTPGDKPLDIRRAIDVLNAAGSTNGSAGIQLAYEKAHENFIDGGINRVILATDGDLNVGVTEDDELVPLIKEKAAGGVFLTVLGFGTGNLKDGKLEKLADNGNGAYAYIDRLREARRVLVEQIGGSLVTIAKDVKIQVEFNPAEVKAYRLIGYENRILAAEDFDDDTKDAGEIGAGHTVTALYELVPADSDEKIAGVDAAPGEARELKYQRRPEQPEEHVELTKAAEKGELLTVALRYKQPEGQKSRRIEQTLKAGSKPFNRASRDMQFASAVASFGMLLRGSQHRGTATFSAVEEIASGAAGNDPQGYRNEFLELVRMAEQLQQ